MLVRKPLLLEKMLSLMLGFFVYNDDPSLEELVVGSIILVYAD